MPALTVTRVAALRLQALTFGGRILSSCCLKYLHRATRITQRRELWEPSVPQRVSFFALARLGAEEK
jgi:hypothetical protein